MSENHPLLRDHARDILTDAPISDSEKEQLWEIFHDSVTADDLARNLSLVPPELVDVAKKLVEAKKLSDPVATALTPVTAALNHLTTIDPKVLNLAETHPQVMNSLLAGIRGK